MKLCWLTPDFCAWTLQAVGDHANAIKALLEAFKRFRRSTSRFATVLLARSEVWLRWRRCWMFRRTR